MLGCDRRTALERRPERIADGDAKERSAELCLRRSGQLYDGWCIVGVAMLAVFVASPGQTYVVSVFSP